MQSFLKENESIGLILIAIFSILGTILVIAGWKMTGELIGLGLMIIGVALLLTSIGIYNEKHK